MRWTLSKPHKYGSVPRRCRPHNAWRYIGYDWFLLHLELQSSTPQLDQLDQVFFLVPGGNLAEIISAQPRLSVLESQISIT